jgi:sugar lactone lactonase YvrE
MRIVAGVLGEAGGGPDSGDALLARLSSPSALAFDPSGALYVADELNRVVRRISADGRQLVVLGALGCPFPEPRPGRARAVCLRLPGAVAVGSASGALYVADTQGNLIWRVDVAADSAWPVAGTGLPGTAADSVLAAGAPLRRPRGVAVGGDGTLYIADTDNSRVLSVSSPVGPASVLRVVAGGDGAGGYLGDGGPARAARLLAPQGLAVDGGDLYIADTGNHVVRRVSDGIMETVVGTGLRGYGGDDGPAGAALLNAPTRVAVSRALLLVSDRDNHRVRAVTRLTGMITTLVGTGSPALSADLLDAALTSLRQPDGVAISARALVVSDTGHHVLRRMLVP